MQRLLSSFFLLITLAALVGCSAIEFAYSKAPGFVAGEFDDAFDLDDAQSARLDEALQNFFAWHKRQELPRYRQLLEQSAEAIADGITAAEFLQINNDFRAAWRRLVARMADDVGDIAASLTPQQIDHYERYYYDNAEEYRDYLEMSAQQREIDRVQRGLDRLRDWFGNLDEFQSERIDRKLQRLPDLRATWIAYRDLRQEALVGALRAIPDQGLSSEQLKFIMVDPTSEHARFLDGPSKAYWQAYARTIEEISQDLSDSQLQHAADRLKGWADVVADLQQAD